MEFPVPTDRNPRILGLFAHPDDEVFCLGGTMASYTSTGATGAVISLTRGEAGEIRDARSGSRSTLGRVRESELLRSAEILGVGDVRCCDYPDGTLAHHPVEEVAEHAAALIDDFAPDVVISFGPDGAYGHPDHVAVSAITRRAAALSSTRPSMLEAVFPRRSQLLIELIVEWLNEMDARYMGTEEFAHGLMLFADGSSMLGYAADHVAVRFYPPGTFILEQGEPPGDLYLVLSGTVDVLHEAADGTRTHLATSGPGSFVGEDGIARGQPRNAHVVAATSVTCFVLSPGRASWSAGRGTTSMVSRFDATESEDPVPDGCIQVDASGFVGEKIRALACHRSQYAIDAEMFPQKLVEGIFGMEYFRPVVL